MAKLHIKHNKNNVTKHITKVLLSVVTTIVFHCNVAFGGVVAIHTGMAHPVVDEGWTQNGPGFSIIEGPINDFGVDAWSIDDNGTSSGSSRQYTIVPSNEQLSRATAHGWTLRALVRVVESNDTVDFSVSVGWGNSNSHRYEIKFGSQPDGDPIVTLHPYDSAPQDAGISYTLEGVGNTYHLYELVYNKSTGHADLFIDGEKKISDYSGFSSNTSPFIGWGARTSTGTGNGDYALIEFIVPTSVDDLLNLFDLSVLNGDLVGTGNGNSGPRRLNALRNMIITASELIDGELIIDACGQLSSVANRVDGYTPPDFAEGPATENLLQIINDIFNDLGCTP